MVMGYAKKVKRLFTCALIFCAIIYATLTLHVNYLVKNFDYAVYMDIDDAQLDRYGLLDYASISSSYSSRREAIRDASVKMGCNGKNAKFGGWVWPLPNYTMFTGHGVGGVEFYYDFMASKYVAATHFLMAPFASVEVWGMDFYIDDPNLSAWLERLESKCGASQYSDTYSKK